MRLVRRRGGPQQEDGETDRGKLREGGDIKLLMLAPPARCVIPFSELRTAPVCGGEYPEGIGLGVWGAIGALWAGSRIPCPDGVRATVHGRTPVAKCAERRAEMGAFL